MNRKAKIRAGGDWTTDELLAGDVIKLTAAGEEYLYMYVNGELERVGRYRGEHFFVDVVFDEGGTFCKVINESNDAIRLKHYDIEGFARSILNQEEE